MQARAQNTKNTQRTLGFFLVAGLAALPALAGTPEVLGHVPADAQMVMVVPDLGELLDDINAINTLMGDQGEPMVMMVTSMIRGMPGINLGGSMAVVMSFEEGDEEPEGVALVPVADFGALAQGQTAENGVIELPMGGDVMYLRNAGDGYAVLGDNDDLVRDYDASGGHLKAHTATLGNSGGQIADGNDLFVYVNFEGFSEMIAQGMQELEDQGEMVEMMGGAEAVAGYDAFVNIAQTVVNDGSSFAMGINFDQASGVSFDVGLQFKDDSSSASFLQNKGNAGKYFNNVPAMDYFFASAFDLSGDGIQKLIGGYIELIEKFDTTGMMKGMNLGALSSGLKGGIEVMGASDNVMGGLLSNTVYYMEVDNADGYIDAIQQMYAGINEGMGELADAGISIDATMDEEPTEINGVDAYGFNFAMDLSGLNDMAGGMGGPNPAMIMGMIFGPDGGPSGYLAKAGDGIVTTMSKDAEFFSMVASAANGENTMAGNASIATTAAMLPKNRIMETYIGADHLVNTAGPMLMMFGVIPEFEPLDALPPIGMACTADGGGFLFRTVLPMNTIGSVMELIPEEAYGDGGDDENMDF
jgi:hypothetical protein